MDDNNIIAVQLSANFSCGHALQRMDKNNEAKSQHMYSGFKMFNQ